MRGPLSVYRVLKLFMLQCVITLNFGGVGFERALSVYSTWRCFCWMGPTVAYKYKFLLTPVCVNPCISMHEQSRAENSGSEHGVTETSTFE